MEEKLKSVCWFFAGVLCYFIVSKIIELYCIIK
ncbi:Uncharacterised protein [Clostridium disporicum]|uniref:Uncharacterized protein n=1 Tax=Clostridium disporicum TaxID=84024 RepID=A0A174KTW4_9CLOT|nr:Uncharacterised protein [Clostridium disporicum]